MRYLIGFMFVLALGPIGCSETSGGGGCRCEGDVHLTTTLECFCNTYYHCDPAAGPLLGGNIEEQTIVDYDCDRRYIRNFATLPHIAFLIDTTTNEVVAAEYFDDCCVCDYAGLGTGRRLTAGDWGLDGCEVISERTCPGPCDVGAFEVQP